MAEPSALRRPAAELPALTRFDVVRRIGEGGAGLVYEAIDRERDARVALKMLRVLDGEMLFRLKEEFRALQDIEHPNLIRLFELISDQGVWFFTMELIDGASFVAYVGEATVGPRRRSDVHDTSASDARTEPAISGARRTAAAQPPRSATDERSSPAEWVFDEARLRSSILQLARGLVALHAAGKVHRDIKPSNVLITRGGRVVILDFGLVRDALEAGPMDSDLIVGTISHMAPEQAAGGDLGPAADWYSVGVVLYQCLTGRQPFDGTASDVLERKQVEDPPPPRDVAPGVPADLDALCMELLARDPAKRPTGEEVIGRLAPRPASERPARAATRQGGRSPFVGRSAEMTSLTEGLARARGGGEAVAIIVEGESGVGKSALVRRFTRGLQDATGADEPEPALVLAGRCYEREDMPYKAIDGVIDALSVHLAALSRAEVEAVMPSTGFVLAYAFPVLRRLAGMELGPAFRLVGLQESRSLLFHALRELFANLAAERPLVLVIDDLQWADADSLAALTEILRPPSPPLFLVATARAPSEPRTDPKRAPFGLPGDVRTLPLTRLTEEEGLELVTLLAGEISPSVRQRIAQEGGGHPLFVDELVRHTVFLGGRAPANVHLDDALFARVSRLDAGARGVLELLAVSGVALPQEVAMQAAGLAFGDFATHLQTLRTAHLARTDGRRGQDAIEPYHDRVREAVAARLLPLERKRCHLRLATALEGAATKDADALSVHWLGAGDDAKASTYARVAAEQARAALAFESAARLFGRALMLGLKSETLDANASQELRITLGETLANAGRGREAAQAYFEAARAAAPDAALDLRRRAAEELLTAGLIEEGDAALRSVLGAVGIALPRTPLVALIALLFYRFVLSLRGTSFVERAEKDIAPHALTRVDALNGVGRSLAMIDTIRAAYFQARALLDALRVGEPKRIAHALAAEAVYYATNGSSARSAKLLAQAGPIAKRAGAIREEALIETSAGFSQFVLGRFPEGLAHSDRGAEMLRAHCPGAFWEHRTAQFAAIWSLGWMGNLNVLAERVEQGLREAEQRKDIYSSATLRSGVPNLTWLRKGDPSVARALVLDAIRQWTQRGYHSQHYWSLLALTRIELYEGDARAAYARVDREWSRLTRALILQVRVMKVEALHLHGSAALAAAAQEGERGETSERARMLAVAERDARKIGAIGWALATPHAQVLRAGVAALRKDDAKAVAELDEAVRGFDSVAMHLHAASARWHLGHLRGGDEGRALVGRAEAWMTEQGVANAAQLAATITPGLKSRA